MQTHDDMALVEIEQLLFVCEQLAEAIPTGNAELDALLTRMLRNARLARMYQLQHMAGFQNMEPPQ